jgi:hypothetical protein
VGYTVLYENNFEVAVGYTDNKFENFPIKSSWFGVVCIYVKFQRIWPNWQGN